MRFFHIECFWIILHGNRIRENLLQIFHILQGYFAEKKLVCFQNNFIGGILSGIRLHFLSGLKYKYTYFT